MLRLLVKRGTRISRAPVSKPLLACCVLFAFLSALSSTFAVDRDDARDLLPQKPQTCDRQLDSLWIVSTRHLCCPDQCPIVKVDLHLEQCLGEEGWEEASLDALLQASRNTMTVIYIPGNRTDWDTAIQEGKAVRQSLAQCGPPQAVTFVIWSWPADQIRGQIRDFRVKAARTNCDGVYLAWFLARLEEGHPNSDSPVSLIGYSFGARIAIGGLHVWSGGKLAGVRLADSDVETDAKVRAVFIAAAEHNYWLQPGSMHGLAYDRIDYALSLYNSCDRALKRYRIVQRHGRPQALGYTGLVGRSCFADAAERFHEYNACCHVGKSHEIANYLFDITLAEKLARYALWNAPDQ